MLEFGVWAEHDDTKFLCAGAATWGNSQARFPKRKKQEFGARPAIAIDFDPVLLILRAIVREKTHETEVWDIFCRSLNGCENSITNRVNHLVT